jgi:hypothetical protein
VKLIFNRPVEINKKQLTNNSYETDG